MTESLLIGNLVSSEYGRQARRHDRVRAARTLSSWGIVTRAVGARCSEILASLIHLGEAAHGCRDAAALDWVAQAIRELPLGKLGESIADYYAALALCRQGPGAWPEASDLLDGVIDSAPEQFQAKALIAQGASLVAWRGDSAGCIARHDEAIRIARHCEAAGLDVLLIAGIGRAVAKALDGGYSAALADTERLRTIAIAAAGRSPILFQVYQNNLAASLTRNGRLLEAKAVADALRKSPLIAAYPEWGRTCAFVDEAAREATKIIITMDGLSATPDPGLVTDPAAVESERGAPPCPIMPVPEPETGSHSVSAAIKAADDPRESVAPPLAAQKARTTPSSRPSSSPILFEIRIESSLIAGMRVRSVEGCHPLTWVYAHFPPARAP